MIKVDPVLGERRRDGKPMRTLMTYRRDANKDVLFAQNLVPENDGLLACGQTVEILA